MDFQAEVKVVIQFDGCTPINNSHGRISFDVCSLLKCENDVKTLLGSTKSTKSTLNYLIGQPVFVDDMKTDVKRNTELLEVLLNKIDKLAQGS